MADAGNRSTAIGKQKPVIITVTNRIDSESMPYNEFVLFRDRCRNEHDQKVIVLYETHANESIEYPQGLPIIRCGISLPKIRKTARIMTKECERNGEPFVFHIHEGKSVLLFWFATLGRYGKRTVYTIHSTFSRYAFHNKLFAVLASLLSRKIVCVSETSFRYYPAILKKILKEDVLAIQNGVYSERINHALDGMPAEEYASRNGILRLVYVARLIPAKRQDILIEATAKLPNVELTLIGDGKQKERLLALSTKYGISDRVHFMGVIPRDEVYIQIKRHDVLYVSSSSYEGLPISLLEAMSCGVVCAVSDIEQHREIQEKCPSLITVNNTPEDWVKAISRIASMKTEERARIAAQNKRDVDRYFSLERMHEQYDRVYQELLERNQ